MRPHLAALALAAFAAGASCDGRPVSPDAVVRLKDEAVPVRVHAGGVHRDKAAATLSPLGEGRGHLLSWPRPRYAKIEPSRAGSFDVAFLDAGGRILQTALLDAASPEGLVPRQEAVHALLVPVGTLRRLSAREGDLVDLSAAPAAARAEELSVLRIDGATAYVELAVAPEEKAHGLMFRPRMSKDDGMLFSYASQGPRSFWMKNTLIPLDIAFFASDGTLLNVNPTPTYDDPRAPGAGYATSDSRGDAQYVLEMNLGWFKSKGLLDDQGRPKPGLKADFSGIPPHAVAGRN
ncbi:MAG TPA: DUF192 domain-containing protein [Planctomycetota bacterium]|nr:DUF192 domain-containing protein [Planctomycetota bacterium]